MNLPLLRKVFAGVALGVMLIATPSSALLVQPVFLDMRYTGVRSNAGLRVVNDRNRPVSVEVTVNRLDIPETGAPVYTPIEGEDFLIFPAVATIEASGTQIFRVRWLGEVPENAQMFAFTTSELPLDMETDSQAAVQLLYAIQTVVAIGAENARPELEAVSFERGTNASGQTGVRILFENTGDLHGQVNTATLRVNAGDWSRTLTSSEVSAALGLGLVPANARRWMFVPIEDLPAEGELRVVVELDARS